MNRSIGIALLTVLLLSPAAPTSAQQAKCLAGKTGCLAKKAAGLLKCEALAETPGKPADPNAKNCVTKVRAKFDGGSDPAKGCFEKLENKVPNDCLTADDTAAAEAAVDGCVAAVVAAIDPPPLDQTKCGAGKKKCAAKYLAALLKCRQASQTPGKPSDPNAKGCVDKATAKYTGGTDPAKGCFAKLEAKADDCQSTTDSAAVQALVERCLSCDPAGCDDGDACTTDVCDPAIGCVHTPDDCNDGNGCTNDTCESDIGCIHMPVDCNDGLTCTDDVCVPSSDGGFSCNPVFDPSNCAPAPSCATVGCSSGQDCTMVLHDDLCPPHPSGAPCFAVTCTMGGCMYQDACTPISSGCNGCASCTCNPVAQACVPSCPF